MDRTQSSKPQHREPAAGERVHRKEPIVLFENEFELLSKLQLQDRHAQARFFDKYQADVKRVLVRILGSSPDVADALQDTFLRAFKSAVQVKDAQALRGWILRVAVSVALDQLRRRQRQRWLTFAHEDLPQIPIEAPSPELREAFSDIYAVLDKLPNQERVAFALRHIDEMELEEIASACEVSLSTIKRKLAKAEGRFIALAKRKASLAEWVGEEVSQ